MAISSGDFSEYTGTPAPAVSPAGSGRFYFDSTSNTFKFSSNGSAYNDICTIGSSAPVDVTKSAASAGVSTTSARSDHKHNISTATASTIAVGGSNSEGTATSLARSDHTHSIPAFGSSAGTFCQGNDSRLSDDRTASGLRTATTIVSISAAAAPTAGQFLVATGGSAATWQTPTISSLSSGDVTGTTTITTTSLTDVLMTGMTVTPAAGTYLVWFSGAVSHSTNNAITWMSIYAGGTIVTASESPAQRATTAVSFPFACAARVTVNGSQAIEGRWRTSAATATNTRRTLMYLKVA